MANGLVKGQVRAHVPEVRVGSCQEAHSPGDRSGGSWSPGLGQVAQGSGGVRSGG